MTHGLDTDGPVLCGSGNINQGKYTTDNITHHICHLSNKELYLPL